MAIISVDAGQARRVREIFVAWRRAQGWTIISEPPESAGIDGRVIFSSVPDEFLGVLQSQDIHYIVG
ncbi:hypothetical protein [Burkholderia cepacia]|uniref:hypothetical protein n=1 Tax=Burkholderia cepacia TaxID=292 RepID=UPI000759A8ED|nr:hypothetical protein [Burkholderia cepacia]KVW83024.1 hypothetical protein WL00_27860 [Burkholderia cepacia]KVX72227.1 hypothetical protein WL07_13910 [Burkholderia cepacia]